MAVDNIKLSVDEMQSAGVHFGHGVSRLHPKMKPYVAGVKGSVHVFDLEKTVKEFESALKFISKLIFDKKTILFVGTKIQLRELIKATAISCEMPYVAERWLGGTFTNFDTIAKRIQYFKDSEVNKTSGLLEKYTKKERLMLDREMESLKHKFEGIKNMTKLPDAVLIFDMKKDIACAKEARKKEIKVIGIVDTNIDPLLVDYMVPANDDAISSIKYILDRVQETVLSSRSA